jgi:hypothetical protein
MRKDGEDRLGVAHSEGRMFSVINAVWWLSIAANCMRGANRWLVGTDRCLKA